MSPHPLQDVIARADAAINAEDFDAVMRFYAPEAVLVVMPGRLAVGADAIRHAMVRIAAHFNHTLHVRQRELQALEAGDTALVLARTHVTATMPDGSKYDVERRSTYVFRRDGDGRWLCAIDNSYGTTLLEE